MIKRKIGVLAGLLPMLVLGNLAHADITTTGCASATSCTLSELYGGGTIATNDVLFDSWLFNFQDGDAPVDASTITVSGVDEVPDGMDPSKADVGLSFDIEPAIAFEFLEYDFDFRVVMVATTRVLTGASLELTGFSIIGDAFVEVNSGLTPGGLLSVDDGSALAAVTFAGAPSVNVDADIQMDTFDMSSSASLSGFDYTFTVMETMSPPLDDTDGDGVPDSNDLCPGTVSGADANGCSDDQVDVDGDGICTPGAPSNGPSACTGADNCPIDSNTSQDNFDGDSEGDACDTDDDNDGESDADEIACGSNPLDGTETCANVVDTDDDGVVDGDDVCANTVVPESVPLATLKKNRYALKDNSPIFDSRNKTMFTTTDTGGCSCEQIIDALGLGGGHVLFGCSKSAMKQWIDQL